MHSFDSAFAWLRWPQRTSILKSDLSSHFVSEENSFPNDSPLLLMMIVTVLMMIVMVLMMMVTVLMMIVMVLMMIAMAIFGHVCNDGRNDYDR